MRVGELSGVVGGRGQCAILAIMKNIIIIVIVVILAGVGIYFLNKGGSKMPVTTDTNQSTSTSPNSNQTASTTAETKSQEVIGHSVGGRDIIAYHYGSGNTELLFVGGIHGGYEWNTARVAYQAMDYLKANPSVIPANLKVTVIPVLNPDGLAKVVGTTTATFTAADVNSSQATQVAGRFNGNTVDLNRNFDCDWQTNGKWQNKTVSGGTAAFSEPESQAIKNYVNAQNPKAVVVWYSSAGGVYASNCHSTVLPETATLTDLYAKASGYPGHTSFDFYETTGDMTNWLAKEGTPAISVLLTNHTDTEWSKNQAGIKAVLDHYAQ